MVDLSGRVQPLAPTNPAQAVEGITEIEQSLRRYLHRGLNALAWAYCLRLLEMDSDNPAFRRYVRQIKHRLETGK